MSVRPPLFLAGATATGKSAVALALAEQLGGEIVSVDSMQVYRGMDVGTAKPTAAERARVPHHVLDVCGLEESFDAARFVQLARAARADIQARGRVPVFCGGTGLYFKAYLEGLDETPRADPELQALLEQTPLEVLLAELQARDPAGWERIDRRNRRRVKRAIEVIRLTGRPVSEQRSAWALGGSSRALAAPGLPLVGLRRDPADLRRRIEQRVDRMFENGLVEETRQLLAGGLAENRTASLALGYRQVIEHLRGVRPLAETVALVKQKTWQFARRQATWFRHQLPVNWVDLRPGEDPSESARRLPGLPG